MTSIDEPKCLRTYEPCREKTGFLHICENKDADQLHGNREADQRLCFRYSDSTIPLLPYIRTFKPLAIFCGCTAWFVPDLVGNPEDQFSHNEAHISYDHVVLSLYHISQSLRNNQKQCFLVLLRGGLRTFYKTHQYVTFI